MSFPDFTRHFFFLLAETIDSDFIKQHFTVNNKTGCWFLTVDAYAAAVPFYLRNGFIPLNEDDINDPTRLLYFDLNDLDEK